MIPGADRITVGPVGRIGATPAVEAVGDLRQQEFQRALSGQVGKTMQAAVLARLADGSFLVRVADTPARMMLPPGAQVGADVPLTLVSLSPRPTFQAGSPAAPSSTPATFEALATALPEGAPTGAPALDGTPLRAYAQGALRANPALATPGPLAAAAADTPHATLSDAAKVITGVLAAALKSPNPPTAIAAPAALLDRPAADPARLAGALKHAIDSSGLFYESHLREWSEGKRPLADLAREPQMQKMLDGGADKPASPLTDSATAQFVNLQLTSHEQGRVAWHGELWPGQPLHWEISKDAPERHDGAQAAPEPAWRSSVRFRFPLLGDIAANVVMVGAELHIQVQAGTAAVEGLLQAHAGLLARALDAAGAPLSSLNIHAGHD